MSQPYFIECPGCLATVDSRNPVCAGCGRCLGCGRLRAEVYQVCPQCQVKICQCCGRCAACGKVRYSAIRLPCECGFAGGEIG
ncbi:hypothetical protein [Bremerella cremea]|uniref:hypothetical protein n=1 Tax=Bremerella cremea TaxID=1031537 RepID=UPI0011C047E5|nr:hypothetical protein [Bremerella cremea]